MQSDRLEAATSRLEDLAIAGNAPPKGDDASRAPAVSSSSAPSAPPPPPPPPAMSTEVPRNVEAFDEIVIDGKLKPFTDLTKSFASPLVIEQVSHIWKFNMQ